MSGWTRAGVARAAGIAATSLAVGFGLGAWIGRGKAQPAASAGAPSVTPEERAFLAPLAVGAEVGGFRVTRIRPVSDGALGLELERGGARTRVDVAKAGGAEPPARFGNYAVYYGKGVTQEEGEALAKAVASALAGAAARPPPAGMGTLRGGTPL